MTLSPASPPPEPIQRKQLVSLNIKRANGGKLELLVNAMELHATLRSFGAVTVVESGKERFQNRPFVEFSGPISTGAAKKISPEVLLVCEYPAKFDLAGVWVNTPTIANLATLKTSAQEALTKILDHYQPVDLSLKIYGKTI